MSYDPNFPANNTPATAVGMRQQLNALKSLVDLGGAPVGGVTAWRKNLPNAPALPAAWVECNGQVLSDAESPFDRGAAAGLELAGAFPARQHGQRGARGD